MHIKRVLGVAFMVAAFLLMGSISEAYCCSPQSNPATRIHHHSRVHKVINYHFYALRTMAARLSAYTSTDGGGGGLTARGHKATYGIAAVDPHYIPFGTKIQVPGYGIFLADDTGGAIRGNRIDLCFGRGYTAYRRAMSFGRRSLAVVLLR